jgi:hypothetical protein
MHAVHELECMHLQLSGISIARARVTVDVR